MGVHLSSPDYAPKWEYTVMPKISVYVDDELAEEVKSAGVSISNVCQAALRAAVEDAKRRSPMHRIRVMYDVGEKVGRMLAHAKLHFADGEYRHMVEYVEVAHELLVLLFEDDVDDDLPGLVPSDEEWLAGHVQRFLERHPQITIQNLVNLLENQLRLAYDTLDQAMPMVARWEKYPQDACTEIDDYIDDVTLFPGLMDPAEEWDEEISQYLDNLIEHDIDQLTTEQLMDAVERIEGKRPEGLDVGELMAFLASAEKPAIEGPDEK